MVVLARGPTPINLELHLAITLCFQGVNTTFVGPGHGSVVECGGQWWLLYHAWLYGRERRDPGRWAEWWLGGLSDCNYHCTGWCCLTSSPGWMGGLWWGCPVIHHKDDLFAQNNKESGFLCGLGWQFSICHRSNGPTLQCQNLIQTFSYPDILLPQTILYFRHFPTKTFPYQDLSLPRHFPP